MSVLVLTFGWAVGLQARGSALCLLSMVLRHAWVNVEFVTSLRRVKKGVALRVGIIVREQFVLWGFFLRVVWKWSAGVAVTERLEG